MPISFGEFKQSHFPTERDVRKQKKKRWNCFNNSNQLPSSSSLKTHRRKKGRKQNTKVISKSRLKQDFCVSLLPNIGYLAFAIIKSWFSQCFLRMTEARKERNSIFEQENWPVSRLCAQLSCKMCKIHRGSVYNKFSSFPQNSKLIQPSSTLSHSYLLLA